MTTVQESVGYFDTVHDPALPRRSVVDRLLVLFLTLGLAASLIALLSFRDSVSRQLGAGQFETQNVTKSAVYYAAHAAQLSLLLGAGTLALVTTRMHTVQSGYLWRLALYFAAGLLMTMRGYSLPQILSTKAFDGWGPFPILVSILMFVTARPSTWAVVRRLFEAIAVALSALTLMGIAQLRTFSRTEAIVSVGSILDALLWPAVWVALSDYESKSMWRRVRLVPLLIYGLGSLFVQTRLNVVMLSAAMACYFFVQHRRRTMRITPWLVAVGGVLWCVMFSAIFLTDTPLVERVLKVANAFGDRAYEDTRTGQLVSFAANVPASELLLGRGSLASWNWDGLDWRGGTDVGYLTLTFFGGVPLLATYVWLHLSRLGIAFKKRAPEAQRVAGFIVLLWTLRMFSSSYPSIGLEYYPVVLCVGLCIAKTDAVSDNSREELYVVSSPVRH